MAKLQPHNVVGGATLYSRGEAQRFAREIVESESYRQTVQDRASNGTLPPAIEALLWYYAYGKPLEQVQLSLVQEDLSNLSLSELQERAAAVAKQLQEAEEVAAAIPGTVV
jgi:hypothetical protein